MTANQIAEILGEDKVRILGELRRFRKLGTVDESDDVPHYLSDVDRADRQSFEFAGTRAEVRLG